MAIKYWVLKVQDPSVLLMVWFFCILAHVSTTPPLQNVNGASSTQNFVDGPLAIARTLQEQWAGIMVAGKN